MFAKLENGVLICAPKTIKRNGKVHYHPSDEMYAEHGFLRVERTEQPAQDETEPIKYFEAVFEEIDGKIVQRWEETEPPELPVPKPSIDARMTQMENKVTFFAEALGEMMNGDRFKDKLLDLKDRWKEFFNKRMEE